MRSMKRSALLLLPLRVLSGRLYVVGAQLLLQAQEMKHQGTLQADVGSCHTVVLAHRLLPCAFQQDLGEDAVG